MPITQSAKKALRQSVRRQTHNTLKKRAYKNAIKTYRKLVASSNIQDATTELAKTFQALDKAAKTKVIKKNKVSRLKSRLAKLLASKKVL